MRHLVIGGAGFIGTNLANHLANQGEEVAIYDNFSRRGTLANLRWLNGQYPNIQVIPGDIRVDMDGLKHAVARADVVYHLAGQVAVTTSVENPKDDFLTNALGTIHILEAVRMSPNPPILLYASTNKVYGGMEDVGIVEKDGRYTYKELPHGVPETRQLEFHSPYGCSKGSGDQYVRDYARIYGLKTVVFRQSCIYGPYQFGVTDQGWVAWFTIAAEHHKPITLYGDGKQVRDVLYVDDLIDIYLTSVKNIDVASGQVYNIGGGAKYTLSLLELVTALEGLVGRKIPYTLSSWRPGDQRVYVSDIGKANRDFGWEPKITPQEGISKLYTWVKGNPHFFTSI